MKRIALIVLVIAVLIVGYSLYKKLTKRQVYIKYLVSVGIPIAIANKMNDKELKASFTYLKQYAKTNQHFTVDNPDYNILSSIRVKYGIFT